MHGSDFDSLYAAYEKETHNGAFLGRWEAPEGIHELVAVGKRLAERKADASADAFEGRDRLALKLELYRRILNLRERGYRLAGGVEAGELRERPHRDLREDEAYAFIARERGLETLLRIEGDLRVAGDLDLLALYEHADVLVVEGDLIVDGAITNREGDYGPVVFVHGKTVADALLVGGAELELGTTYLHLGSVRWYNHGSLSAKTDGDSFATDLENDRLCYAGTTLYDFASVAAALFHPHGELFDLSWVDLEAVHVCDAVRLDDPNWIAARLDEASAWDGAQLQEEAFLELFDTGASRLCLLETFSAVWSHAREAAL